jgi:hypothetical protein
LERLTNQRRFLRHPGELLGDAYEIVIQRMSFVVLDDIGPLPIPALDFASGMSHISQCQVVQRFLPVSGYL